MAVATASVSVSVSATATAHATATSGPTAVVAMRPTRLATVVATASSTSGSTTNAAGASAAARRATRARIRRRRRPRARHARPPTLNSLRRSGGCTLTPYTCGGFAPRLQVKAVAGSSIKNRVTETPKVASTEEAEAHFKQLLVDAGVRPTQKWKDVYKELMTDGRFKLLKSGRRKQVLIVEISIGGRARLFLRPDFASRKWKGALVSSGPTLRTDVEGRACSAGPTVGIWSQSSGGVVSCG